MNKKFEANVASELPKTRRNEPGLPWKLNADDLNHIDIERDEYRLAASGSPPLKTRGIFLIMLVLAVFGAVSYMVTNAVMENEKMRLSIETAQSKVSALKADLQKVVEEKNAVAQNTNQLEKRVNDLTAQKELFTSVIETLTKKGDETEFDKKEDTQNSSAPR